MDLGYRPLVYMWVAEYSDGQALPQFDPETGKENRFAEVDHSKLVRFGWYPFSARMAAKIKGMVVIPTRNPSHVVELKEGDKLFAVRRNHIEFSVRGGGTRRVASLYLLGIEGGEILKIREDGSIHPEEVRLTHS